jgi:hypothetical protein
MIRGSGALPVRGGKRSKLHLIQGTAVGRKYGVK